MHLIFPLLALAASPSLNVKDCRLKAIEPCFEFCGRASAALGRAGTRIWKIGSKRIYEVGSQTPKARVELKQVSFHQQLFATFEACPIEETRPGAMQSVCIQSVTKRISRAIQD